MKNLIISLIILLAAMSTNAKDGFDVRFSQPDAGTFILEFSLGDYVISQENIDNTTFSNIGFEGSLRTKEKGFASLPFLSAAIQLPAGKNMKLTVSEEEFVDIQLGHPLLPSRGIIYRDQDPSSIPFVVSEKSLTDQWYPAELAEQTNPYIIRDIRGATVYVYPFRYNAVKQVLRIYTSIKVELAADDSAPVNPLISRERKILPEMDALYRSVFINYDTPGRDDLTIGEAGDILVICTARDEAAIEPYIQWKREMGYNVSKEVVATGTNVESLVQQKYDENNDLLYVQLVGDWPDIKSNTLGYGSPMDPQLGCVVGTDDYADICVGRLSSNNASHVTAQIDKIIAYEKTPDMGEAWYSTATGIASSQGPGDDGEMDYEHNDVIFDDKLDPFTYDVYNDIYDPSANVTMVNNAVNGGTGVINYTGHGSPSGWGSSGFSISNVNNLTNGSKLPFIVSVACNNGDFHQTSGDCFAEAWLKKENAGAVMFLGATISQPWDPPMRGQDYFMDILTGGYDYSAHPGQNGINTTEQRTTIGSVVFNGLTLMTTESGGSDDWETAKTWTIFGDPSLQLRTAEPEAISSSNNTIMSGVPYQTTITSGSGAVEGARVTISQDGEYYSATTDASGMVSIPQTFMPGTALLVVTGFNLGTIYETIDVIPASGAYVVYAYHEVNDAQGNGNGMMDYGEMVRLSVALTNIGSEDADGVSAVIESDDTFVSFTDNQENYGNIPAGDTVFVMNAFEVVVDGAVPDMHNVLFNLSAEGDEIWTSSFPETAHAPVLFMTSYVVDDPSGNGNGKLDPGEEAEISITIENSGSADAFDVTGSLGTLSAYVTVNSGAMNYGQMNAGSSSAQIFTVEVSGDAPAGHSAGFEFSMNASLGVQGNDSFFLVVGQIPVLIIDLDGNSNSADAMLECCENLGVGVDIVTAVPGDLELYSSVFVCLGIYPENHVLNSTEGQKLADYLGSGGNVYMEGGDTWAFDSPTAVHPLFSIEGVSDGGADMVHASGQNGTMVSSMEFDYSGDNNYMDHIAPEGQAQTMFKNSTPSYECMIANETDDYKTIGASFEFGGLDDEASTKDELMAIILDYFGIESIWTRTNELNQSIVSGMVLYPNPANDEATVQFEIVENSQVKSGIYALNGQKIVSLAEKHFQPGTHNVRFNTTNIPQGVYIFKIYTDNGIFTRKLVVVH